MGFENFRKAYELETKLKKYSDLEGTELQETVDALCFLSKFSDYLDEDFYEQIVKEMERQLKNFEDNFEIVERTETYTTTVRDLEEK